MSSPTINDVGLALIKRDEGLELRAYLDPAGIWTIGYGHTPARQGQVVTEEQATELLRQDVAHAEAVVSRCTADTPTTLNQFSAMVSLCFNIGEGAFRSSSVLRFHRSARYGGAAGAFLLWGKMHVNGQLVVSSGLLRRRMEERALYLTGAGEVMLPAAAPKPVAVAPKPAPKPAPAPVDDQSDDDDGPDDGPSADDLNRAELNQLRSS